MSTSAIWSILRTYRPNAANEPRTKNGRRFGVFEATYVPPRAGVRGPRTDREAQALYNHIRTVAFWLDASPILADLGLPFRAGIDDIISLVPLYGDVVSGILQLYQVWLSFLFGVPIDLIGWMLLNVILDVFVGIIPLLGDILDNLFKSNLRNLALLEQWLLTQPSAAKYHILLMPETDDFIPTPTRAWAGWFKGNKVDAAEQELRRAERATGKVRRTRRMARDEGDVVTSEPLD